MFSTFSDWLSTAQKNFSSVSISIDVVDRVAMERKMKKLEVRKRPKITCPNLAKPAQVATHCIRNTTHNTLNSGINEGNIFFKDNLLLVLCSWSVF